jgi:hypothetical protein
MVTVNRYTVYDVGLWDDYLRAQRKILFASDAVRVWRVTDIPIIAPHVCGVNMLMCIRAIVPLHAVG